MAGRVGAEDIETVYDELELAESVPEVHNQHIQAQNKGLNMETRRNLGKNRSHWSTPLKVALAVITVTLIAIIVFLGIREGTGLLSSERKSGENDGTQSWVRNESTEINKTNGGWSVWSAWTDCSATCNTGVQTRHRQCNNPEPSNGGQYCQGSQIDVVHCNKQQCSQTTGGWSVWLAWTDCSATCNTGLKTRQRQCNNPVPSSGGQYCQGSQMDVVLCNTQQCSQRKVAFVAQHSTSANEYAENQQVIFATVNYNYGGAYDSKTGIFTVPESGTYLFSFHVLSGHGKSAHVSLVVEGKRLGEADASGYTSAGNSDVVYLEKGARVWIETNSLQSQYFIFAYKSQFMGVLLD